ncbi:hypothetical protein [Cytobacillus sp. IB215665]|nr:hypothetical protein [Cytobacillus sp. IB215665]MDX8367767.1 hypothetical protein [Cytobacillus sp. IB215665]
MAGDTSVPTGGRSRSGSGDVPVPTGERFFNQDEPIGGFMPPIDPDIS